MARKEEKENHASTKLEAGKSAKTTDHKLIRQWIEERGGAPATVIGTGDKEGAGVLRVNFPGFDEAKLEEISWEEFFEKFDEKNLAFLYQEKTKSGDTSRFFKFVTRE